VTQKHRPGAILHWHAWGNDLAFPYSYQWQAELSKAELYLFQEYAMEMTARNHYASGRAWEVVGYTTNGEADDWGWGAEKVPSFTLEVGSSRDGFWPSPSRIAPIAEESIWPATYLLAAAGPQMQLDSLSVVKAVSATSAELQLTLQNNGQKEYWSKHNACIRTRGKGNVHSSGPWQVNNVGAACVKFDALKSRQTHTLPTVTVEWEASTQWAELELGVEQIGGSLVSTFTIRLRTDHSTLSSCDDRCICPQSADFHEISYSQECRAKMKIGSHCRVPKPARAGTNYANGVDDEFFTFTATEYKSGGACHVGTSQRDTMIAVYADCSRVGGQQPVAFSNSEGHLAQVDFPCTSGHEYFLFWNAEYVPGRHAFSVTEKCSHNCVRAHRKRERLLRRSA